MTDPRMCTTAARVAVTAERDVVVPHGCGQVAAMFGEFTQAAMPARPRDTRGERQRDAAPLEFASEYFIRATQAAAWIRALEVVAKIRERLHESLDDEHPIGIRRVIDACGRARHVRKAGDRVGVPARRRVAPER
jgi:hypothetical protein